ncbi:hypothetical protein B0H13DRAFT_1889696 [Mycena leptocephala]|nr:hypothetical protein B0H13DRAFT_1889696 [Mycena leptocephala]
MLDLDFAQGGEMGWIYEREEPILLLRRPICDFCKDLSTSGSWWWPSNVRWGFVESWTTNFSSVLVCGKLKWKVWAGAKSVSAIVRTERNHLVDLVGPHHDFPDLMAVGGEKGIWKLDVTLPPQHAEGGKTAKYGYSLACRRVNAEVGEFHKSGTRGICEHTEHGTRHRDIVFGTRLLRLGTDRDKGGKVSGMESLGKESKIDMMRESRRISERMALMHVRGEKENSPPYEVDDGIGAGGQRVEGRSVAIARGVSVAHEVSVHLNSDAKRGLNTFGPFFEMGARMSIVWMDGIFAMMSRQPPIGETGGK